MTSKKQFLTVPNLVIARALSVARILIAMLFIYSGFSKLIQPIEYFEIAVRQYSIIPDGIVHYISLIVPWIELIFGSYVLFGFYLEISGTILCILTGMFQLVLAQAVMRRLPIDECGCFGGGFIHLTLYQSFALDTILVIILIQIISSNRYMFAVDNIFLEATIK